MGMHTTSRKNPGGEAAFMERLRRHPQLRERFEAILKVAEGRDGEVEKADEVEGMLVEQVRQLGNEVMREWAQGAWQKVEGEFLDREAGAHRGKKNS